MVELRKRPAPVAVPPPAKKKATASSKSTKPAATAKATETKAATKKAAAEPAKAAAAAADAKPSGPPSANNAPPKAGESITLESFGGEVQTNDEVTTTLAKLVADSKVGVVLFTYPKASTPGCTTQACMFRDSNDAFVAAGLSVYGLSADSPKANTTFKNRQNLTYPLLCDPKQTLINAIGMKKKPSGTIRGVFVVNKAGKVLAATAGGPANTVQVVERVVADLKGGDDGPANEDNTKVVAETAAEVADTAADLDKGKI